MAIDRQFIGYRMPPFDVVVDPEHVRRFALAIGASGDAQASGDAPPTYLKVVEGEGDSTRRLLDLLGVDLKRVLHAEQEFEFGTPLRGGDHLSVERVVADIYDRKEGAMEFLVVESTIRRTSGTWMGSSRQSILIRHPRPVTA